MRKRRRALLGAVILTIGLGVILYPLVMRVLAMQVTRQVIGNYEEHVAEAPAVDTDAWWEAAEVYNRKLFEILSTGSELEKLRALNANYDGLLNPAGDGIMSYLEIPKLQIMVPIYHGIQEQVLEKGAGHILNTSLPTGELNTHCAVAAHTGLPQAKLFDSLCELKIGDRVRLHTLGRTLTYEVNDIAIYLPEQTVPLSIAAGQSLCTLITCYPYGINTHRLYVTAQRIWEEQSTGAS